jgi:hypothetical protein
MHRPGVQNEILPCPRVAHEKFRRQQIAFESIAAPARQHQVAGYVRTAVRERVHVIECGEIELERGGAIHAAMSAVAHGGALDRALLGSGGDGSGAARGGSRYAWEGNAMKLPASGQCHLAKKATPRGGRLSRAGCRADR